MANEQAKVYSRMPALKKWTPYNLLLTAPSMEKQWNKFKRTLRSDVSHDERQLVHRILRYLTRNDTYSITAEVSEAERIFTTPWWVTFLALRRAELHAYTMALAVRASSNFVPVIRLPPSVNNVRTELHDLGAVARANGASPHRARKLSKLAKQLSSKLISGLPDWLFDHLRKSHSIKLVADTPLEWMDLDGVPLMLKVNVSRIPTTPGNLFFRETVAVSQLVLSPKAFSEVLVIRAFQPNDRIRQVLTSALQVYQKDFPNAKPTIRFEDVETEEDLVTVLNDYSGALAVYDGHGWHSEASEVGTLCLPRGEVNPWDLRARARIPPIVVLSACDTHPYNTSHVTTANGFLAAGARTVLGTSLPVDARYAAMFVGRLLLRISRYMPYLLSRPIQMMRWSEIIPGLQRREYASEVIFAINGKDGIRLGEEDQLAVGMAVGMAIDGTSADWFAVLVAEISRASAVPESVVRQVIEREAYLTNALLYVQLGNPEQILVTST